MTTGTPGCQQSPEVWGHTVRTAVQDDVSRADVNYILKFKKMRPKFSFKARELNATRGKHKARAEADTKSAVTSCARRSSAGRPLCARSARPRRSSSSTRGRPRSLKSETPESHPPPASSHCPLPWASADHRPRLKTSSSAVFSSGHPPPRSRRSRGHRDRPPSPATHSQGVKLGPESKPSSSLTPSPQRTSEPPELPLIFPFPSSSARSRDRETAGRHLLSSHQDKRTRVHPSCFLGI